MTRRARLVGEIRAIARGASRGGPRRETLPYAVDTGWGLVARTAHGVRAGATPGGLASRVGFVPYLSNPPPEG